jgi:hypothetical protein
MRESVVLVSSVNRLVQRGGVKLIGHMGSMMRELIRALNLSYNNLWSINGLPYSCRAE